MKLLKNNIDSLFAALLGALLVIIFTRHGGVGISPDSIYYISAADSLKQGHGYYQFDNTPFIMFPLFFPSFIAGLELIFRTDIIILAPFVNAFLFGATIFTSGCMLEKTNHNKWIKWIVLFMIVASPSLLEIYSMLWSETLFVLEVLLFIWFSKSYFENYTIKNLIIFSAIAAIASVTRLAGVSLIATGGLLILLSHDIPWRKKINDILIYSTIASSLFVINMVRNLYLTNTLTGIRQKGITPLLENIKYYGIVLSDWMPFSKAVSAFPTTLGIVFLGAILVIFIYRLIRKIEHDSSEKIAATFTWLYSFFMLVTATFSRYETINNRLLAPFFIPCLFTLSFYSISLLRSLKRPVLKYLGIGLLAIVGLLTISEYLKIDRATLTEYNEGGIGGYTDDDWSRSSELINFLRKDHSVFHQGLPVYSNASHAVYFFTKQHLLILPERNHAIDVKKMNASTAQLLIWFNEEGNRDLLTLEELRNIKTLTIWKEFKDGYIFRCATK